MIIILAKIVQLFEKIVFVTEYDQPKQEAKQKHHCHIKQHKKQKAGETLCGSDARFCEYIEKPRCRHESADQQNPYDSVHAVV